MEVDFAQEKEQGYQRIFARSPLISQISEEENDIYLTYDRLPNYSTAEVFCKQHGIAIFMEMPVPAQAKRTLDGKFRREQVKQGDFLIVPANVGHRAGWQGIGGVLLIGIDPLLILQVNQEREIYRQRKLLPQFATSDPLIYQMGLAIKTMLEQGQPESRLYIETMINALLLHLLQYYSDQLSDFISTSRALSAKQQQQVTEYIQDHLDQNLSLQELADLIQVSPSYFGQLFKQTMGKTPHQYLIQCRIERAQELLRKPGFTITEVAHQVGFVDQSHLHRYFKRLLGITPKYFLDQERSIKYPKN